MPRDYYPPGSAAPLTPTEIAGAMEGLRLLNTPQITTTVTLSEDGNALPRLSVAVEYRWPGSGSGYGEASEWYDPTFTRDQRDAAVQRLEDAALAEARTDAERFRVERVRFSLSGGEG